MIDITVVHTLYTHAHTGAWHAFFVVQFCLIAMQQGRQSDLTCLNKLSSVVVLLMEVHKQYTKCLQSTFSLYTDTHTYKQSAHTRSHTQTPTHTGSRTNIHTRGFSPP